jgi:hypothetical protein
MELAKKSTKFSLRLCWKGTKIESDVKVARYVSSGFFPGNRYARPTRHLPADVYVVARTRFVGYNVSVSSFLLHNAPKKSCKIK